MPPVLASIGGSYLLVLHPELTRQNICFCRLHAAQVLGLQLRREIRPRQNVHAEGWIKIYLSLL